MSQWDPMPILIIKKANINPHLILNFYKAVRMQGKKDLHIVMIPRILGHTQIM